MAHSLELLLDDAADQLIRAEWSALSAAGLRTQGDVAAATNRPHITVLAAAAIAPGAHAVSTQVSMRLPVRLRLGGILVFGSGTRRTLARSVAPSSDLLAVHAQVTRLAADHVTDGFANTLPGAWTPHVTLARRLTPDEVATALSVLGDAEITGTAVAIRQWDSDAGTEDVVAGRAC